MVLCKRPAFLCCHHVARHRPSRGVNTIAVGGIKKRRMTVAHLNNPLSIRTLTPSVAARPACRGEKERIPPYLLVVAAIAWLFVLHDLRVEDSAWSASRRSAWRHLDRLVAAAILPHDFGAHGRREKDLRHSVKEQGRLRRGRCLAYNNIFSAGEGDLVFRRRGS